MKLVAFVFSLFTTASYSATLTPIQLLNPAGSTLGQFITSSGPTTAPAWTTVTLSGLNGVVPIAKGGTGATTQPAALTALLGSSLIPVANGGTGVTSAAAEVARIGAATTAGNLSQFASSTSAQLATVLSDETGTGAAVFGTSPVLTTPTINQPNIVGVTNNGNAAAGSVGETPNGGNTASIASNTSTSIGTMSLTAGNYLVWASGQYACTGGNVVSIAYFGVSTTQNSLGGVGNYTQIPGGTNLSAPAMASPVVPLKLSANTTVYATGNIVFSSGTCTLQTVLNAVRIR